MGKVVGRVALVLLAAAASAQIQHEVSVVNVSIPVRVFDGAKFVDSLKLDDFEVSEDGRVQPIEAVYLVRGSEVKRKEGVSASGSAPAPETGRRFVLLFQLSEYLPEIDKAVDVFFDGVYQPGDAVDIVTPQRTLRLMNPADTPEKVRKAQYEVKNKLRADLLVFSGAFRSIMEDMLAHLGVGDEPAASLTGYRLDLEKLEALQTIDPGRLAAFAADLRARPGAKHAFLFYQREKAPQLSDMKLNEALNSPDPNTALTVNELMAVHKSDPRIDREAIQRAFSDASVDVHFLYVTRNRRDPQFDVESAAALDGIQMAELSTEVYKVFREIAAATGGTYEASANPAALLRRAAEASEQYYMLYYRPQEFQADGKFHRISVRVRRPGLRVSHREGYFAVDASTPVEKPAIGPVPVDREPAEKAGEGAAAVDLAGFTSIGEIENIDLTGEMPVKGGLVPDEILRAAAGYCRNLEGASLDFVCREEVRERLSYSLAGRVSKALEEFEQGQVGVKSLRIGEDLVRSWAYDYQLLRREGEAAETRILLEENGRDKREERASLQTTRFGHKFVVLGPVGLFSEEAQLIHEYRIAQEATREGEPILVIDVRPKGKEPSSLFGQAWVRPRDGAVLKIEWEPASMGNYSFIEEFAKASRAQPRIRFCSEYGFEKNGLRFPSRYEVVEAYLKSGRTVTLSKTEVAYKGYKFFEVKVRSEIRRGG